MATDKLAQLLEPMLTRKLKENTEYRYKGQPVAPADVKRIRLLENMDINIDEKTIRFTCVADVTINGVENQRKIEGCAEFEAGVSVVLRKPLSIKD